MQGLTQSTFDKYIKALQYLRKDVQYKVAEYQKLDSLKKHVEESLRKGRVEDLYNRWSRRTAERCRQ